MSKPLPRRLRAYRFERVLGRGGMGIVHLAYDEHLRRHVAIKKLRGDLQDPRRRERLRREARAAARLNHPSIVQIFDLVEADDGDWIVMERVEGSSLAGLVRDGPLAIDRVLSIGRQIADGLAAAHTLGILHRDLKTENIAVLPDGRVKILDFGLAKQVDIAGAGPREQGGEASVENSVEASVENSVEASVENSVVGNSADLSHTGQLLGTGRAMSPEQVRGLTVDPRSDLFALGVLLYEIAAGVSPFRADTFFDTLTRVTSHQPPSLATLRPELPPELAGLVERLLAKAPELRPASARAVADELARLDDAHRVATHESSAAGAAAAVDDSETWAATASPSGSPFASSVDGAFGIERRGRLVRWAAVLLGLVALGALLAGGFGPMHEAPGPGLDESAQVEAEARVDEEPSIDDPLALYETGMDAVRRVDKPENIERALAIFQRLLEADPDSAAAHAGLARVYWEKGRGAVVGGDPVFLEQAESVARAAVRLGPYLADAHVSLGLVLQQRGEPDAARQAFDTALELEPTSADGHFGRARLEQSEGDRVAAERDFRRAFALRPEPLYGNALGAMLYAAGRLDEAEEAFAASLAQAPDNVYALRNLGALAYARGRLDDASQRLQEALAIRPDASLYSNLGTILFARGLYPRAAAAFEDALEQPGAANQWIFWLNLGDAYRQMPARRDAARDAYRRAVRLLDEALETSPENPRLLSRRHLALARAGDLEAACGAATSLESATERASVYDLLSLAVVAELCGERRVALERLDDALRGGLELAEVRREPDLLALRADPRFHDLVAELAAAQ